MQDWLAELVEKPEDELSEQEKTVIRSAGKASRNMTDEETLAFLDHLIDSDHDVSKRALEQDELPFGYKLVRNRFGGLQNAIWRTGHGEQEILVKDGDTEIAEHELRGLEHELGRAPTQHEAHEIDQRFYEDRERASAGLPYETFTRPSKGLISPQREEEVVDLLFIREEEPHHLIRSGKASEREIDHVLDAYLPWVDETVSHDSPSYSIESPDELPETVFEMVADGLPQREIKQRLDIDEDRLRPVVEGLKQEGLIETGRSRGTYLTSKGEELYETDHYADVVDAIDTDLPGPWPDETTSNGNKLPSQRSLDVLNLIGRGYTKQADIAEEQDVVQATISFHVEGLKEYGLVRTERGEGTYLTEEGERVYQEEFDREPVEPEADEGVPREKDLLYLIGKGYNKTEAARELGLSDGALLDASKNLKDKGLTEASPGAGTWLTEKGEKVYEEEFDEEPVSGAPDDLYGKSVHEHRSDELIRLLGEGYNRQEAADEMGLPAPNLQPAVDLLKEDGLIETRQGAGTWLTEEGQEQYEELCD